MSHSNGQTQGSAYQKRQAAVWLFLREIFKNPKAMGAAFPSSAGLARAIATSIPLPSDGIVIELGGGTGVITDAILHHGVPAGQLYVIERSAKFCHFLRRRFPGVTIIEGDAARITDYFPAETPISSVISGLPLKSLPAATVHAITSELGSLMNHGCTIIQFTYDLRLRYPLQLPLQRLKSEIIWKNFPPARVDVSRYTG